MKRFVACTVIAASVMVLASSLAQAQQEGGRRGRGGPGGFGGMMFGSVMGGLVNMPEVQKELKLTEDEIAKVKKVLEEIQAEAEQRRGGGFGGGFRDLSEEERNKRREEMRKQFEETAKKIEEKLKATLTEAQFQRLNELRVQREGFALLERDEYAKKLQLTDDQKAKIKELVAEMRPGRGQFGQRGERGTGERPNFEQIREEMQKRAEKFRQDMLAVLTPEQQEMWELLKGEKFDFPEPQGFGGFGGGGRRNRGQRPAE